MNVGWQQQKMLEYCKEKGIHVSAYSPLGARGSSWGSNAVMENSILDHIAASMNKTIPQVQTSIYHKLSMIRALKTSPSQQESVVRMGRGPPITLINY